MNWIEILGYAASAIIAIGMLMTSIRLLRWINFIGAAMFSIYGFMINSLPVGIVNGFIAVVDLYFLGTMYFKKEFFKVLTVRSDNNYLLEFLEFYKKDIQKFFPSFFYKPDMNKYSFFVLRDMAIAGVILAREYEKGILKISLDYTIPKYRDFKIGHFVYNNYIQKFKEDGYSVLITFPTTRSHKKYLKKMGFVEANHDGRLSYVKNLS
jgi:hypothetical protein